MASSLPSLPWLFAGVGIGAVALAAAQTGRSSRAGHIAGTGPAILSARDRAVLARMLAAYKSSRAAKSQGSRAPQGSRATLAELRAAAAAAARQQPPARQQPAAQQQGVLVGKTKVKVNEGAMWKLAAEKMYGDYVDVPVVATREALQNSWDAIAEAVNAGMLAQISDGRFDVTWDAETRTLSWADNGIGMSESVADTKFLSLGDTSKIATMSSRDMQRGGFGIAKAILLGASENFNWTLHTRNRIFTSTNYYEEIEIRTARPRQGTELAVIGIAPKHVRATSYWSYQELPILDRLVTFLQSCDAPFSMRFNGIVVEPSFTGPGTIIAENAQWGEGVTGRVRSYERSDIGGCLYLRLGGLTQFWQRIGDGKSPLDVVVDLETRIRPTETGYPLTASRMDLSGPAEKTWKKLMTELTVDLASATKGTRPEFVDEPPSPEVLGLNQSQLQSLTDLTKNDPDLQAMFDAIPGFRSALDRASQRENEGRPPPPAEQKRSQSTAGAVSRSFQEMAAEAQAESPPEPTGEKEKREKADRERQQAAVEKERIRVAELRGSGFNNPFAGVGALRINRGQWSLERLKPYLEKPSAILPILFLWRAAIALVLAETWAKDTDFMVGFIFDDELRAEYGDRLFSLNPVPIVKLYQELPSNPEIIAAYLHNKACHEVTHRLGYSFHNEDYVIAREALADKTAGTLGPLTRMVALVLGMTKKSKPVGPRKPVVKMAPRVLRVPLFDGRVASEAMPEFAKGLAALLTHAGYPTRMGNNLEYSAAMSLTADGMYERYEEKDAVAIEIRKVSFKPTIISLSGVRYAEIYPSEFEVRDLLTPAERKLNDAGATQIVDLTVRAAKKIVGALKGELRPLTQEEQADWNARESGSGNRSHASTPMRWTRNARRQAVAQADAILMSRPRRSFR